MKICWSTEQFNKHNFKKGCFLLQLCRYFWEFVNLTGDIVIHRILRNSTNAMKFIYIVNVNDYCIIFLNLNNKNENSFFYLNEKMS